MDKQWQCNFIKQTKPITVGDKLTLLCKGETKSNLKPPLYIKLSEQQAHSLKILKTFKAEDHSLMLEVAPYRTGDFQGPFMITDGQEELVVQDFSFFVTSVIKKSPSQTQGPFGPFFTQPMTLWMVFTFVLIFSFIAGLTFLFIRRIFKRKKFIQKVLNRQSYSQPSKFFILGVRQKKESLLIALSEMENLFKTFLEDLYLIPAVGQTNKQIIKNLKKFQYNVYKKEGQNFLKILNEFSSLKRKTIEKKAFLKLKTICQNMVFLMDNKTYKKKRIKK